MDLVIQLETRDVGVFPAIYQAEEGFGALAAAEAEVAIRVDGRRLGVVEIDDQTAGAVGVNVIGGDNSLVAHGDLHKIQLRGAGIYGNL